MSNKDDKRNQSLHLHVTQEVKDLIMANLPRGESISQYIDGLIYDSLLPRGTVGSERTEEEEEQ